MFSFLLCVSAKMKDFYPLKINDQIINSENSVKLGIEIDNKLSFDKHISTLCKKASNQLNAIGKIQKYTGFKEISSIVLYTLTSIIAHLYGIFAHQNL